MPRKASISEAAMNRGHHVSLQTDGVKVAAGVLLNTNHTLHNKTIKCYVLFNKCLHLNLK